MNACLQAQSWLASGHLDFTSECPPLLLEKPPPLLSCGSLIDEAEITVSVPICEPESQQLGAQGRSSVDSSNKDAINSDSST